MMEKRYQVFVSSTYQDLREERQEVMQALLELDCIPSGMELFPAADDDQWTLIKRVIDDSDYYIVIVANRYGTIGPDQISYTEMEYAYALTQNKPIIGFIHKSPTSLSVDHSETDPKLVKLLDNFRSQVRKKTVRFWTTPQELGSVVSRSIIKLMKNNPAIGWVRADAAVDELSAVEILRLRRTIDTLNSQLVETRRSAPHSAAGLASGDEIFRFEVTFKIAENEGWNSSNHRCSLSVSWNRVFSLVGPYMFHEVTENEMKAPLANYASDILRGSPRFAADPIGASITECEIKTDDFQTIKIQLLSLGLIEKGKIDRITSNKNLYWILTSFGEYTINKIRSVVSSRTTETEVDQSSDEH